MDIHILKIYNIYIIKLDKIKHAYLDCENCNIYQTLFKLKSISNLNFNPMTVIEFLKKNHMEIINSNPVFLYASRYNEKKKTKPT